MTAPWRLHNGGQMGERINAFDWARTPLGPMQGWPAHLKAAAATVVECRLPMYLAWGPELIQLYNDAYTPVLGSSKHPLALGSSARQTWAEIWPTIGPMWERVWRGESIGFDDFRLTIERDGRPQDCFFNFSYSPIRDDHGAVAGLLVTFAETTARVASEARFRQEREKLHSLFMQAPVAICITRGHELRFELVNPLYQKIVRRSEAQLLERCVPEVFPDLSPDILQVLRNVMQGERFVASEFPVTLDFEADGVLSERFFNLIYEPFRGPDGAIEGILTLAFDVTELVLLRRKAQQADARSKFALEAAEMGEWDLDLVTGMATRSLRHDQCFGHQQLLPRWTYEDFLAQVRTDHRAEVQELLQRALGEAGGWNFECPVVWPDGSEHWIAARSQVESGADGQPRRVSGLVWDVTESRQAQEALQRASRQKDEFLATLAHELRNPLAPIRSAAHALASGALAPEQLARSGRIIEKQVEHMALLLDDLLDVSRITSGKIELRSVRTGLQEVIRTAAETVLPAMEAKRHALVLQAPQPPCEVDADPLRLAQVLTNLLTNAAKYTDPGGRIVLSARCSPDGLTLAVQDNGIGIAPHALPGLFQMFSQVPSALDRTDGGLGIGLALSRGLVELHGGRLTARSDGLGLGTTFEVWLPPQRVHPQSAADADGAPPADAAPPASSPAPQPSTGRSILIVDDNRDAADTLATLLELEGHVVTVAYSGDEALARAERSAPQVAILDIGMPGMDGYQLAQRMRAQPWGSAALLIAATGWGAQEDQRRAAEAGFDQHLTKPLDPARIVALLAQPAATP